MDFAGRVTLITGGGSGIGAATARLLAERGAGIAIFDIDESGADAVAREIRATGKQCLVEALDVSDARTVQEAVSRIGEELGRIDVLVNNAGIGSGGGYSLEALDEAAFDRMFDVHVKGAFLCTKAVVPLMKAQGYGRIINISSNRGLVGFESSSHYCGAKAALLGLTKAWAKELGRFGIQVNAVAPGIVLTPMSTAHGMQGPQAEASWNLVKRWAQPEEIAQTIAFLASPQADFYTGQVLSPNGGDPVI
jgi:3-oxoacyl-[acyl-carrier protein] reductase